MSGSITYDEPQTGGTAGGVTYDEVPYGERRGESFMAPKQTVTVPAFDPTGFSLPGQTQEVPTRPRQKYEDYPTLSDLPNSEAANQPGWRKMWGQLLLSSSPEHRVRLLREQLPGANITEDRYGNPLVEYGGQRYHIDRPDFLNTFDVQSGTAQAALPMAGALATGAALPAATVGVPLAVGAQALMGGGTEWLNRMLAGEEVRPGELVAPAAFSALPEVAPALRGAQKSVAPLNKVEAMPPGARHYLSDQERAGRRLPGGEYGTMPIDVSPYQTTGLNLVGEGRPGWNTITRRIEQREAERPTRIRDQVDSVVGPPPPAAQTLRDNLDKARITEGRDPLNRALQAPPPDLTGVVQRLKTAQGAYAKGTDGYDILQAAIKQLEEPSMTSSTAQTVQNYYRQVADAVDYGPPGLAYKPGSPDYRQPVYKEVQEALREALNTVPGYDKAMREGYGELYKQKDLFTAGRDLLSAAGAGDRMASNKMSTDQALAILRAAEDPAATAQQKTHADVLRAGLRAEMEQRVMRGGEDLSGLRLVAGRNEMDPRRELLDAAFGPGTVNRLVDIGERESMFRGTAEAVAKRREQHRGRTDQANYERSFGPGEETGRKGAGIGPMEMLMPWQAAAARLADYIKLGPLTRASRLQHFPGMPRSVADVVTQTGQPLETTARGLREMVERDAAVNRVTQGLRAPVMGVREEQTGPAKEERERRGRAGGGRIGTLDHLAIANGLIRAAEKAKKGHGATTEPLLDQPDEAITKALAIANEALS
jgi:hypothetical protein